MDRGFSRMFPCFDRESHRFDHYLGSDGLRCVNLIVFCSLEIGFYSSSDCISSIRVIH